MGQEVATSHFSRHDFQRFRHHLENETLLLEQQLKSPIFSDEGFSAGVELEAWLLDKNYQPNPNNKSFLKKISHPQIVHELARYCIEINGAPYDLQKSTALSQMRTELNELWQLCHNTARKMGAYVLMAGTAPTLHDSMVTPKMMSESKRFFALQDQFMSHMHNEPIDIHISGSKNDLHIARRDLLLASCAAALHIHLKIPVSMASRFFNATQALSPAMVALSANSPFLFGRELWVDSRVPIFEQSLNYTTKLNPHQHPRVFFGSGFARPSLIDYFKVNLQHHPPLLAPNLEDDPSDIAHLNLHNGTVWRWNRLVTGGQGDEKHIRIEHRCADSGPTIIDTTANIAFYVGCAYALAYESPGIETQLSYPLLERAFYRAAQYGLQAYVNWRGGRVVRMKNLLLQELLPKAKWGLSRLGVPQTEVEFYIQDVLCGRVQKALTGSRWQHLFVQNYGDDFVRLTEAYFELQQEGLPVHTWPVPTQHGRLQQAA